jgi:choline kinase
MKAIIVAAGRGRRLGVETDDIPKCMVKVGGRPILHWQIDALAAAGVDDVVIVRGYLGDRIAGPAGAGPKLRFVDNPDWANNNILASLFYAEAEMQDGFLFSYSDIVFSREHARRVAAASAPVALIVDRLWRDAYHGRTLHPVSEAELARVAGSGAAATVTCVGKRLVAADEAAGEFSGLARFGPAGAAALREVWREARASGMDAPFGAAAMLRQAYLSDGLNAVAERGVALAAVLVDGGWREIDTEQDLARAELVVDAWRS